MPKNLAQQAAFILLDAVESYPPPAGRDTMTEAVLKLNDHLGMITAQDREGEFSVDISRVVNASIVSTYVLAYRLAEARGVPIESVLADLRSEHESLWTE